jgi:uncharacterized protein (TIGR02246 family)
MTSLTEASLNETVALYQRLLEAWNRRDAEGFASLFAADGSTVGFDGSQSNGREEIASALRKIFEGHPTAAYVAKVREVRPLDAAVTLLRAAVGMVPPGTTELKPDVNAIQSLVIIARSGQPQIALLQNTPAAFHGRPEAAQQLSEELKEVVRSGETVARL